MKRIKGIRETRTYEVMSFDELSDDSKQKAIEKNRDINIYDDWATFILDDWKEQLNALGYDDVKIYYSGFWSQGGGASFEATVFAEKWLRANSLVDSYDSLVEYIETENLIARIDIKRKGNYYHENTMMLKSPFLETPVEHNNEEYDENEDLVFEFQKQFDNIADIVLEHAKDLARQIYRELGSYYEDQVSDEAVIETFEAEDYLFDEKGNIS